MALSRGSGMCWMIFRPFSHVAVSGRSRVVRGSSSSTMPAGLPEMSSNRGRFTAHW